jgi:hypothetical protein
MREIDPVREPSEALLSSALHRLASATERNAPEALQASLLGQFRRHHRRRRQKRFLAASVVVFLLLVAAMLKLHAPAAGNERATRATPKAQKLAEVPAQPATKHSDATQLAARAITRDPRPANDEQTSSEPDGFIALPSYDPATASGELQVVRVELPGSELRMLGAPVLGDLSDQPLTADFITDRDGTPYAVRLVQ